MHRHLPYLNQIVDPSKVGPSPLFDVRSQALKSAAAETCGNFEGTRLKLQEGTTYRMRT